MLPDDLSRLVNARFLKGDPSETTSSRLWRKRWHWHWGFLRLWVDWLAMTEHGEAWGHCRRAYNEHRRRQAEERARVFPDSLRRFLDEGV